MTQQYMLGGTKQVEPKAACWDASRVRSLSQAEIKDAGRSFPKYPSDDITALEMEELKALVAVRDEKLITGSLPALDVRFAGAYSGAGYGFLGATPTTRLPLSKYITEFPLPFGARVYARGAISTGRDLARLFQSETPGLIHRQVLHSMFSSVPKGGAADYSPPRQALVWSALEASITSAIHGAWQFKWLSGDYDRVSYRQRPAEYNPQLDVLFDHDFNPKYNGNGQDEPVRVKLSGTPRHPAFPSGHSTVAGAASELLSYFFPQEREELDKLADNIGMARLWGGVHWRSDHLAGMTLGRNIARFIITHQLESGGFPQDEAAPEVPTPGSACR